MSFVSDAKNYLTRILEAAHNSLFPRRCAGCRAKGSYLCEPCANDIPIRGNYGDKAIYSVVPYGHKTVRQLIWLLKYRGVCEIADIFASWLYEALLEDLAEAAVYREKQGRILIVPIPLSKKRYRLRGYNQAEEIATRLVALDPRLFRLEAENLIKAKETKTQVSLKNRQERLNNLKGVFRVKDRHRLRGRTIILLDDVSTTGATLDEAAKALSRGKPRRLIKITVAGG